uniref:Phospholipase/carboxylesterase/thioesterase domain-containing protein n=1 Tax=Aplanochytrium stocchinoi TaxID=215587 RepID=A0A7S3PHF1_9STRA|mmetsp:Transcript_16959/g.20940  ORF Transcript_16959/g.20940 Transcript_16959/m.20940 type:complete len:237 (-) Transcript_16959:552-1262(-)
MEALVIFLHGSGDTGPGVRDWVNQYSFESRLGSVGVSVQFPTATPRPYTLWGGETGTVWMNRLGLNPDAEEETTSIKESMSKIDGIIDKALEEKLVSSPSRIFVGGFSQGGCLALYIGLSGKYQGNLGGIFCCSGFLPNTTFAISNIVNPKEASTVSEETESPGVLSFDSKSKQPVLMLHGDSDSMVSCQWGEATAKRLSNLGMKVSFEKVPNLEHQLNGHVIDRIIYLIKSQMNY